MIHRSAALLLRIASAVLLGAGSAAPALAQGGAAAPVEPPTLVVLVAVDQLRGDYLDRFGAHFTAGFARLQRGGALFTNAYHDHAVAETAPGHASMLSGRFPRGTGIVMNAAGVQDPQAPLLGSAGPGASPFRFRGSTLVDWLRLRDPRSRALSVSRKDRGAILPLGRVKQDVFWYAGDGRFTTSTYYADTLPAWVQAFNARGAAASLAGRVWTPLLADSAYHAATPLAGPDADGVGFQYMLSADPDTAGRQLPAFPWMDDVTADLALEGVATLGLGAGPAIDLLAVSFSTMDAVGHQFGPDSRELHDQVLRLDLTLGRFLDSLFTLRDSSRVVIALTSDHGVAPLPDRPSRDSNAAGLRVDLRPLIAATDSALQARGLPQYAFDADGGAIIANAAAFARAGVPMDSVLQLFAATARQVPGVLRVDRFDRLAAQYDTASDAIARRWLNMYPPDLAPALVVTLTPFSVWGPATYFQHGVPHAYDTHVPVLFYGAAFRPGRYDAFARVVDIAPTLAAVLGVTPTEPLDGHVLRRALTAVPAQAAGTPSPDR